MSLDRTLYRERINAYKVSGKDGKIDSIKKSVLDNFLGNPSHENVVISDIERDVHIVSEGAIGQRLLCRPGENIKAGEYVIWGNRHFLATFRFPDDKVQVKATIQETNHMLKWIDNNDNLITKPCIISAKTLYTTGIEEGKEIVIPDGMFGIQVAYDEDTKDFKRGDVFIFNGSRNVITFKNKVEYEGLLVLICEEKIINSNLDDVENEIANRYREDGSDRLADDTPTEPEVPDNPDEDNYIISIIGNDRYPLMTEETYVAKVLNNGVEVTDKEVVFSLSNILATIKSQGNNVCTLKTNTNFKTGKFILTARLTDDDTVFSEKEIIIIGF